MSPELPRSPANDVARPRNSPCPPHASEKHGYRPPQVPMGEERSQTWSPLGMTMPPAASYPHPSTEEGRREGGGRVRGGGGSRQPEKPCRLFLPLPCLLFHNAVLWALGGVC